MNCVKYLLVFLTLFIITSFTANAMYWYESNPIEYTQGDGVTKFMGHYLVNPFYSDYWTEGGYAMIPTKINGKVYYAYAMLDANGDYTASDSLVGIHQPLQISMFLKRSSAVQDSLDEIIQNIIDSIPDDRSDTPFEDIQTVFNVNVFLTKFNEDNPPSTIYSFDNFEQMLNSPDYYGTEPELHPEGEEVRGGPH